MYGDLHANTKDEEPYDVDADYPGEEPVHDEDEPNEEEKSDS